MFMKKNNRSVDAFVTSIEGTYVISVPLILTHEIISTQCPSGDVLAHHLANFSGLACCIIQTNSSHKTSSSMSNAGVTFHTNSTAFSMLASFQEEKSICTNILWQFGKTYGRKFFTSHLLPRMVLMADER
jgi:hypothetical protein